MRKSFICRKICDNINRGEVLTKERKTVIKREKLPQELHDWVISKTVERLYGKARENKKEIYTNPSQEKNYDVKGLYPDIVVYNPKTKKVDAIDEIETVVGEIEKNQWEDFAELKIPYFYVTVPLSEVANAKKIIGDNEIEVSSLWSYSTNYPKEKTIKFKKETL